MSFQDIEATAGAAPVRRGSASSSASVPKSHEDALFLDLQSSLSLQVFKMNANVQGILKLVDQLGTSKDSTNLRKSLHDLTDSTRAMVKRASDDLKKLTALQAILPHHKTTLQKTSHDMQMSMLAFQRAQQVSAERQRTVVEGVRLAAEEGSSPDPSAEPPASPEQRQAQLLQNQLSPQELEYQESLIQEREHEIQEIEGGIQELSEIFLDLGRLVQDQGQILDNVETNIESVATTTGDAAGELSSAAEYQRKAGRRAACLMLILILVVAIVLVAVLT
ncbi:t-SNARE [Schizophyllum fasciatum]